MSRGGSGLVVLRVVAGLMVALGVVGLVTSFMVFGQVGDQLARVDATVQSVASTLGDASKGVGAAHELLSGGTTEVVSFLDGASGGVADAKKFLSSSITDLTVILKDASKGLADTSMVLKDAKGTVASAQGQLPSLIDSTAATIETASKAVSKAGGDVAAVGLGINDVRKSLFLDDAKKVLADSASTMKSSAMVWTGQDLINWAPWVSRQTGLDEFMLIQEGERLNREKQVMVLPLDQLQITGDHLSGVAGFLNSTFQLDASQLEAEAAAARARGIMWIVPGAEVLKQLEGSTTQVDGLLTQTRTALTNSGQELKSLSGSLEANVKDLKGTKATIATAAGQAGQFLTVADQQLAVANKGLDTAANQTKQFQTVAEQQLGLITKGMQSASEQTKKFKSVADTQLTQINKGLQGTADSIKQVSVSSLGGSLISGLRFYMMFTYLLFIVTGIGLFAVSSRLASPSIA